MRPDGGQLADMANLLAAGRREIAAAATFPLPAAAQALCAGSAGHGAAAVVLTL